MIWVLVILGLILVGAGSTIGRRRTTKGAAQPGVQGSLDVDPSTPITLDDAFDILSKPMEHNEPVKGRYQSGLLTGLGGGLIIAALGLALAPASMLPQRNPAPAPAPSGETTTPAPSGGTTAQPPTTTPTTPATPSAPATVDFTVAPGDLPSNVAANLQSAGLIADPAAFLARLTERGVDTLLKSGTFSIPTGATLDQVIDILTA